MEKAIHDGPSENAVAGISAPAAPDDLEVEVKLDLTKLQMSAAEVQALIDRSPEIKSPSAQQLMEHLGHYANDHS